MLAWSPAVVVPVSVPTVVTDAKVTVAGAYAVAVPIGKVTAWLDPLIATGIRRLPTTWPGLPPGRETAAPELTMAVKAPVVRLPCWSVSVPPTPLPMVMSLVRVRLPDALLTVMLPKTIAPDPPIVWAPAPLNVTVVAGSLLARMPLIVRLPPTVSWPPLMTLSVSPLVIVRLPRTVSEPASTVRVPLTLTSPLTVSAPPLPMVRACEPLIVRLWIVPTSAVTMGSVPVTIVTSSLGPGWVVAPDEQDEPVLQLAAVVHDELVHPRHLFVAAAVYGPTNGPPLPRGPAPLGWT